jgi:hypothetical protein
MGDKMHPEKAYECKGRVRATRKGKPFCYRIVKAERPGDFEVQFHSLRTGKLIGYLAPQEEFTSEKAKAQNQFHGFKVNAEFQMQRLFQDAESRDRKRPWTKKAKELIKKIGKEAEKKPTKEGKK